MDIFEICSIVMVGLGVFLIFYFIAIYNQLVNLKNEVSKNWANIDVLLVQRNNELNNLIASCKQYMQYEQNTLERVVQARQAQEKANLSKNMQALGSAETALRSGVAQMFALAEKYPDLKANDLYRKLQSRIVGLENSISDRRIYYNESVNINNIRIQKIPDIFIARACRFGRFELLIFDTKEKQEVEVKERFDRQ